MYRQMDIFDFIENIEKPPESEQKPPQSQFDQLFEKVRDPVCKCTNCLCEYCVNNVLTVMNAGYMMEILGNKISVKRNV